MQAISKFYKKDPLALFFLIDLGFYLLSKQTDFQIGMTIFGIPLLLYLPGRMLLQLFPSIRNIFGQFGRFSFATIISFALSSLIGLTVQNIYGFNSAYQSWAIVLLNVVVFIIVFCQKIFRLDRSELPDSHHSNYKIMPSDYLVILIFVAATLAVIAFNPLPQNLDNYLNIFKLSISENKNFLEVRKIFTSSLGISYHFLKLDIYLIYNYLFVILFLSSTLVLYDYLLRNIKAKRSVIYTIFLSFLISPAILTEIIRTMSQVALISLTIPVLILTVESIRNKKITLGLLSFCLAVFTLLFHELGIVLVFVSLVSLIINTLRLFIENKSKWFKYIVLVIILILIFFFYRSPIFSPLIQRLTLRMQQNSQLLTMNGGIHWRWWFINNYKTVEGVQLGWSGLGVLLYYLYGGIMIFLPLLYSLFILLRNKFNIGLESIPTFIYFLFYFSVAEIFPRLNLAFLPNRAWVHMMLPAIIIITLICEKLSVAKIRIKYLEALLIILIIVGLGGTIYLSKNNIYEVYPSEINSANYIKNNTAADSIILSSQNNSSLVNIYAERRYGQVSIDHQVDRQEFELSIQKTLTKLSEIQSAGFDTHSFQAPLHYNFDLRTGYTSTEPLFMGNNSVYFLYSYAKIGGLNDQRSYRQNVVDSANQFIYDKLNYPIVYSDESTLLIKVR